MPVQTQIQVRRSTAATWTSTNPTLAAGELGFETDTNRFKIGTGSSVWTALSYANDGDITAVTAGTGISGGGTSGAVTVTNSMATTITTKGDIVTGTGSGTFDRLAAGANGETIVADSSATTGLRYQGNFAAGKNKIINGDFGVWQRGTSFTAPGYTADRWNCNNGLMTSFSATRQTFTPGTAPVAGYEGTYYIDLAGTLSNASTGYNQFENRIEDVQVFAGQTVTLSFWAKGSASGTINSLLSQNFGTGGTAGELLTTPVNHSITTSWTRFTQTVAIPSISGKTVGTSSYLKVMIIKNMGTSYPTYGTANYTGTLSVWGVQLEAGSTATAFQTATGTIQGELAACQRYYIRYGGTNNYEAFAVGFNLNTTTGDVVAILPVELRAVPTAIEFSTLMVHSTSDQTVTAMAFGASGGSNGKKTLRLLATVASGLTTGQGCQLMANNSSSAYLGFSAEL